MDWVIGIVTGVVAGVVSSVIFFVCIGLIKPKINISEEISVDSSNPNVYRIKVVNLSRFKAINLSYSLHYAQDNGKSVTKLQKISPMQYQLSYIDGFKYKRKYSDYAIRLTYEFSLEDFPLTDEKNVKLIFVFFAEHSLSNKGKLFKKIYTLSDIKEGKFQIGKSTEII